MINLVLQPEIAEDNTDRAASVAATASVKNPPHLDALLIFHVESVFSANNFSGFYANLVPWPCLFFADLR